MVQAGPPCRFLPASAPLPHLPTLSLNWSISRHYLFRMWGTSEMSWFKPFTDEELVPQRGDDTVPDYRLRSLTSREIIHNSISEFLVTSTWDNKLQVNKLMYTCKSRNHKAKRKKKINLIIPNKEFMFNERHYKVNRDNKEDIFNV